MGDEPKSAGARRRGPAEPLTRERIVAAALGLIDSEGLNALSMRRLGKELGVDPMAIYYHLPNKSALYDAIMDEVVGGIADLEFDSDAPLEEWLVQGGRAYRDVLYRHKKALPLLTSRPLRSEHSLVVAEMMIARLHAEGLLLEEATAALNAFSFYIAGFVNAHVQHDEQGEYHEDMAPQELLPALPADQFPFVLRMLSENAFMEDDDEFDFMLRVMARGFLATVAGRKG